MSKKSKMESTSNVRKLAAILFSDITGYTAMMQSDEKRALVLLEQYRVCHEREAKNHNGQIIQYYGDACLMIFDSAYDAVKCGEALQLAFREEPKVPVRVGLHLGDVVHQEGNIFGDAVNVASRVESMGIPGAILFSETIRISIKGHPELGHQSLGSFDFKNIEEPIEVFALSCHGFPVPKKHELKGKFKEPAPASDLIKKTKKGKPFPLQKVMASVGFLTVMGLLIWSFVGSGSKMEKPKASETEMTKDIVHVQPVDEGEILDPRDGEKYKWKEYPGIGKWMVDNLRFEIDGSTCYKDKIVCSQLGRLYTWDSAIKACPDGWKLPGKEDWEKIIETFGGEKKAFASLTYDGKQGFAAQLGGAMDDEGNYSFLGDVGDYWTSSNTGSGKAWYVNFNKDRDKIYELEGDQQLSFSCRCIEGQKSSLPNDLIASTKSVSHYSSGPTESNVGEDRSYSKSSSKNETSTSASENKKSMSVSLQYNAGNSGNYSTLTFTDVTNQIQGDLKIGTRKPKESKSSILTLVSDQMLGHEDDIRFELSGKGSVLLISIRDDRIGDIIQSSSFGINNDVDGDLKIGKKAPERATNGTMTKQNEEMALLLISNASLDDREIHNLVKNQEEEGIRNSVSKALGTQLIDFDSDDVQFSGHTITLDYANDDQRILPVILSIKR